MILEVQEIGRRYGGVVAVNDVSFTAKEGSITALIGPNGAGKTTTLSIISGMTPPSSGRTLLEGADITGLRADQICRRGMARTFQTPQTFSSMSVLENVVVGTTPLGRISLLGVGLRLPHIAQQEQKLREEAQTWLDLVGVRGLSHEPLGKLSFGTLRLVELARALASHPKIILMDEPASGLSRAETQNLRQVLLRIRDRGTSILLVEHNMPLVMSTADHVYVLDKGKLLAGGTPGEVQTNPLVQKAYLGTAG